MNCLNPLYGACCKEFFKPFMLKGFYHTIIITNLVTVVNPLKQYNSLLKGLLRDGICFNLKYPYLV